MKVITSVSPMIIHALHSDGEILVTLRESTGHAATLVLSPKHAYDLATIIESVLQDLDRQRNGDTPPELVKEYS